MDKLTIIKFNNHRYISHIDIITNYKCLNIGCKTTQQFIKRHGIDNNDWIFLRKNGDDYGKSNGKSRKFDKVFIRLCVVKNKLLPKIVEYEDNNIKYKKLPKKIDLENHEKFYDNEGNIIDIDVVGIRHYKKCYFGVDSIEQNCGIKYLHDVIQNKKSNYVYNHDYLYFTSAINNRNVNKKLLYLTYRGILRTIFTIRKHKLDNFIDWATKTLFTAQMGFDDDKDKLVAKIIGTNPKNVREVFRKSPRAFPCIYLLSLGKAKYLRKTFKLCDEISDDVIIYKYGRTNDLKRRIGEHEKKYGSLKGVTINLECFVYIDPKYTSEAETMISEYFEDLNIKFKYEKHNELIQIENNKILKKVINNFISTQKIYGGIVSEFLAQIEIKDRDYKLLQKDYEIMEIKNNHLSLEINHLELENMRLNKKIIKLKKNLNPQIY